MQYKNKKNEKLFFNTIIIGNITKLKFILKKLYYMK